MIMRDKTKDKLSSQSQRFFKSHYSGLGQKKNKGSRLIHGRRTLKEQARIVAKAAYDLGVNRIKHITPTMAQQYLIHCRDRGLSQKYLSSIKRSLERTVYLKEPEKKLDNVIALPRKWVPLTDRDRAYTNDQIREIITHLSPAAEFSTLLAYHAGLRVEELLTIKRLNEATVSTTRKWSDQRFLGREEGTRYIITGKNGLRREVMFDKELAQRLESQRLDTPQTVYDRGEPFLVHYDILGGKRFSEAFSHASYKTLGWSHGAHGLRFSYAQQRMDNELLNIPYSQAKLIVSQELGHFREHITDRYIEPYGKMSK